MTLWMTISLPGAHPGNNPAMLTDKDLALNQKALKWLLAQNNPSLRHLVLRDLVHLPAHDPEMLQARQQAHQTGMIADILAQMQPEGYWVEAGAGYLPKYTSTVWSIVLLAQLGAELACDARIAVACQYLLDHALAEGGQFGAAGTPSSTADCLQGNLLWALRQLGCTDARLEKAYDWLVRSVSGEGIAAQEDKKAPQRYYAGKCAPNFACGSNNKLPCAWGAVKVMLALGQIRPEEHTPLSRRAVQQGIDFLLGVDPATAAYPTGYAAKPSQNWWKFGFPVYYVTDLLQLAEALGRLGCASDVRLDNLIALICEKRTPEGTWLLAYDYQGKTWGNFGEKKQPNPWVTLRALTVLNLLAG